MPIDHTEITKRVVVFPDIYGTHLSGKRVNVLEQVIMNGLQMFEIKSSFNGIYAQFHCTNECFPASTVGSNTNRLNPRASKGLGGMWITTRMPTLLGA